MLPASLRMRSAADFRRTISSGARRGCPTLVVHAHRPLDAGADTVVGFVVSKAVGGAVVRNRVKRRLRHLARPLLTETPAGTRVVVRALPPAATATDLGGDLSTAWHSCLRKLAAYRSEKPAGA